MYSGRAGIVRLTVRASALMRAPVPAAQRRVTRRISGACVQRPRVGILLGRLGALPETHAHGPARIAVLNGEVDRLAWLQPRDNPRNVLRVNHRLAVDRDDYVAVARELVDPERALGAGAATKARVVGRTVPDDAGGARPALHRVAEPARKRRRQVGRREADIRVGDRAGGNELLHRPFGGVDRHREADTLAVAAAASNLRVDPDHASARVEERPPGVAVVDRRVRLDRVDEVEARSERRDRAAGRRDDADGERVLLRKGAADGGDRLADGRPGRGGARGGRERVGGGLPLDQADVVDDAPPDDLGLDTVPVLELDEDAVGGLRRLAAARGRDHV